MSDEQKCKAEISEPPWYIHYHQCRNRVKVGDLCGIHSRLNVVKLIDGTYRRKEGYE